MMANMAIMTMLAERSRSIGTLSVCVREVKHLNGTVKR
jgi:hypothetical protein